MIQISPEHQRLIGTWVADGVFRDSKETVEKAIDLLRNVIEMPLLDSIKCIQAGIDDAKAGRTKLLVDVAAEIRTQLQARL